MAANVRRAAQSIGRTCAVLMDLPGPKLRTGPIAPGPRVIRLRPERDLLGRPIESALAVFVAGDRRAMSSFGERATVIPVDVEWLTRLCPGDLVSLHDTRDARRVCTVKWVTDAVWARSSLTPPTLPLVLASSRPTAARPSLACSKPWNRASFYHAGDVLTVTSDLTPVDPRDLRIGCTLPDALASARVGDRVLFDDGKIGGHVVTLRAGEIDVLITSVAQGGTKLRSEKGMNLPDTDLHIAALGPEDALLLPIILECADAVALSFSQRAADVTSLQDHLESMGGAGLGIVLKIETVRGFETVAGNAPCGDGL